MCIALVAALFLFSGAFAFAQDNKVSQATIDIRDYCDPSSFNTAVGPGTCVRDTTKGEITFSGFVAELTADKSVGAWRFAPQQISVSEGATLHANNLGGETHTLTEVKRFGGGLLDFLNGPSGNPIPAPDCAQAIDGAPVPQPPSDENIFIPAGGTATVHLEHGVTARYQCCIHPWMRLTITSKDQHPEEVRSDFRRDLATCAGENNSAGTCGRLRVLTRITSSHVIPSRRQSRTRDEACPERRVRGWVALREHALNAENTLYSYLRNGPSTLRCWSRSSLVVRLTDTRSMLLECNGTSGTASNMGSSRCPGE